MSTQNPDASVKRNSVQTIKALKNKSEAFVALTAYTAPIAKLADKVADLILVGDSLGMVLYGMKDTLAVTLDLMIPHAKCVAEHSKHALTVIDMPFGTYQASPEQAFINAARALQETGVQAVKLEGGAEMAETIRFLTQRGIPVLAHIGLRPQNVNMMGGFRIQGKNDESLIALMADAKAVEQAGAFAVVVEGVVADAASLVTKGITIPTIGIGASHSCDGQILVTEDLLGITPAPRAKFVKTYLETNELAEKALTDFAHDVKTRCFPASENTYTSPSNPSNTPHDNTDSKTDSKTDSNTDSRTAPMCRS